MGSCELHKLVSVYMLLVNHPRDTLGRRKGRYHYPGHPRSLVPRPYDCLCSAVSYPPEVWRVLIHPRVGIVAGEMGKSV